MDLEDYRDEELRSRYRFRLDSLEFLTEILKKRSSARQEEEPSAIADSTNSCNFAFFCEWQLSAISMWHFRFSKVLSVKDSLLSLALARKRKDFISWPSPSETQEVERRFYDNGGGGLQLGLQYVFTADPPVSLFWCICVVWWDRNALHLLFTLVLVSKTFSNNYFKDFILPS